MSKHVEPTPHQDEETHDQLMRAFQEYFKANQKWINKGTRRAGEEMRYWLAQIRIIARERRSRVQQYRVHLDQSKALRKASQKAGEDETE
jgi:hypothetical protein